MYSVRLLCASVLPARFGVQGIESHILLADLAVDYCSTFIVIIGDNFEVVQEAGVTNI